VFAAQNVGIRQEDDQIWLVSFMDYDIGYFDLEACRVDPVANPFGPRVLTMSPVYSVKDMPGTDQVEMG
jgi:putative transposase